jgi:SET domain-containing protein
MNFRLHTYLAPSKVCDGVGVFALTDILKYCAIFSPPEKIEKYAWNTIPDHAKAKIRSLTHHDEDGFWIDCSPDRIYGAYYINFGENPNVRYSTTGGIWYAMRDIKKDEELLCHYPMEERDWLI